MSYSRTAAFAVVSFNRLAKQFKTALPYILGTATTVTYCYVHKPFNKHHAAMLDFFRLTPSSLDSDVSENYPDKLLESFMAEPITNGDILKKTASNSYQSRMEIFILKLQKQLCRTLEQYEAKENNQIRFKVDRWTRDEGGGGITCVMQDGDVFEKAGVNISVVHGQLPVQAIEQMRARGHQFLARNTPLEFFAAGISSVIHPRNPHVPTIHFNYRYFELIDVDGKIHWWYGG
jgi:coproporphyrinogen III oxidase